MGLLTFTHVETQAGKTPQPRPLPKDTVRVKARRHHLPFLAEMELPALQNDFEFYIHVSP